MTLGDILVVATAYLIGALPSAYLVGRRHGVYLTQAGDGNLGTRNTFRVLGLGPALLVGTLDVGKGALATWVASRLSDHPVLPYAAALSAVMGHDFSVYIRFAGGKGMATVLGSLLVLHPVEALFGLALAGLALLLTHQWDVSWSLGMASMLAWSWGLGRPPWQLLCLAILFASIGLKKLYDRPRQKALQSTAGRDPRDGSTAPHCAPQDPHSTQNGS
jgi:glycerol-3-phosphate acyltransferase PlsY